MARTKNVSVPEVGSEAPEFNLPSAQGGNLRLSMRTVRGPVIVVFHRGMDSDEDVAYFKDLAAKEDEINLALGSIVGIGISEVQKAREFLDEVGMKSYVLYDYAKLATSTWGLLERNRKSGDSTRPATFLVDTDGKIAAAWTDERPSPDELLAKVSDMTGLPKPPGEDDADEKPKRPARAKKSTDDAESGEASAAGETEGEKPAKPSAEEREKRRAERKAARENAADEGESPDTQAKAEDSGGKPTADAEPSVGKEDGKEE